VLPNAVALATYDAANEQTAFAGMTLTYDNNGNLTNDGVNTYQWDSRNRLVGLSGGTSASFVYDPFGRRIGKTVNGTAMQFLYDGLNIVGELGEGSLNRTYIKGLNLDEVYVRQAATENEHFHVDALGTTLQLTNSASGVMASYSYEPFGKTTEMGSTTNALQYTGRENDGTGLYYYRARYFSPIRQRFITEDPIGFLGGDTNIYAYVHNAPLGKRDPLGLWDPEYHRKWTKDSALACGMSDADADALANVVFNVDFSIWPLPSPSTLNPRSEKHGMPLSDWQGYGSWQLNSAIAGGGLGDLGRAIHALQDGQAHAMARAGMLAHRPKSLGGLDPDNPNADANMQRASKAQADTINAIRAYMLGRGKRPTCGEAG